MNKNRFSLITNVLDVSHLTILRDWIDFFDWLPVEVVAIIGSGAELEASLRAFCQNRGLKLSIIGIVEPNDLKENEPRYLRSAFEAVQNELAALVHLDTLPFRIEQKEWLKPALRRLEADGSLFVTGSTRLYQMDMPTDDIDFFHTQRLSNNFLLISPADWLSIQDATAHKVEKFGRFSSEASIEHYCAEVGVFGIRIKNSTELRVFHAHEWGPRMREVRQRMHNGEGIQPFLMGWEEDFPPVSGKLSAALFFLYFSGGRDRTMTWDIHRNAKRLC